jgi:hypothetical protein
MYPSLRAVWRIRLASRFGCELDPTTTASKNAAGDFSPAASNDPTRGLSKALWCADQAVEQRWL